MSIVRARVFLALARRVAVEIKVAREFDLRRRQHVRENTWFGAVRLSLYLSKIVLPGILVTTADTAVEDADGALPVRIAEPD